MKAPLRFLLSTTPSAADNSLASSGSELKDGVLTLYIAKAENYDSLVCQEVAEHE